MNETHPLNPYGINYIRHPIESKTFYKFNEVKRHVHLSTEDQYRITEYSLYFGGSMLLGCLGGILLGRIFKKYKQYIKYNN